MLFQGNPATKEDKELETNAYVSTISLTGINTIDENEQLTKWSDDGSSLHGVKKTYLSRMA